MKRWLRWHKHGGRGQSAVFIAARRRSYVSSIIVFGTQNNTTVGAASSRDEGCDEVHSQVVGAACSRDEGCDEGRSQTVGAASRRDADCQRYSLTRQQHKLTLKVSNLAVVRPGFTTERQTGRATSSERLLTT